MRNPYFKFKQFNIQHDRCAMKVGTDGVLLGAWCDVETSDRVLDIGCGSALIAIMVAQRSHAIIDAIEIDEPAAQQACENVAASPWNNRIAVYHTSLQEFLTTKHSSYDAIVCNPPFFNKSLSSSNKQRTIARHTATLSYEILFEQLSSLLTSDGHFSLIYPADLAKYVAQIAKDNGWYLHRQTGIKGSVYTPTKRVLEEWRRIPSTQYNISKLLTVEVERHSYSSEYKMLTEEFYL